MRRALLVAGTLQEIQDRIEQCEENKKQIINYIHALKEKFLNKEISYLEYEQILEKKFDGKTLHEWLDFYDSYAENCKEKIKKGKRKKLKKEILTIFYALFVIFLLLTLAYYGNRTLSGFIIKEAEVYTQTLDLEFNQPTQYEWFIEQKGQLISLKISGEIEETEKSSVKIYLDDLLILDSSVIKETKSISPITGLAIGEEESFPEGNLTQEAPQTQKSPSQEEPLTPETIENITQEITNQTKSEIKILEFKDICEETCNLRDLNLNKSSYILKIEITNAKLKLKEIKYEVILEVAEFSKPEIIPETNRTLENITLEQEIAIIGKPVKFKAEIKAKDLDEAKKILPKIASEVSNQEIETGLFEIEYETPAPEKKEEKTARGKIITVSGPEEIHYENVIASTELTREAPLEKITLYHITENKKEKIDFLGLDTNNNSLIDKIEWLIPSLSNQTYELIIEISRAEHLDENKTFISDIYEQVYKLDDIWSEEIYSREYVRVTFKQNLTSNNDITLYPRVIQGNPKIQVYEFNKNEIIAEFLSLNSNQHNKVYLTNLISESQDTFDLKIIGGSIEINHIIDPDILRINATTASYGSTDIADTACDAGSLDVDDTAYCGQSMSIEAGEAGYVNSTHTYSIPSTATITSAWICAKTDISTKLDDNAADNVTIYVAENESSGTGAWKYYAVNSCQSTGCTAWETETLTCYNVISIINNPTRASAVQISARAYQGDADANQYVRSNWRYVNISYTTPDLIPPNISIIYPTNTTYNSAVIQLNYTVSGDATSCMYYNGTENGTITCGVNLSMIASESSNTWIVFANDSAQNQNYSSITFLQDTRYPIFYNYTDNNATVLGSGLGNFSVNINSTNGTVFLDINGANYTASNISTGNLFNVSVTLSTGVYAYYWLSYGNGTSKLYNVSAIRYYTTNASANTAPQIRNIWNNTLTGAAGDGIDPIENGTSFIQFNITVYDENGFGDLNDNSIKANFTRANEAVRQNTSCLWIQDFGTYYANYSCTIDVWYFDAAGDWNITAYIEDNAAKSAQNSTTIFSYKLLKSLIIAPNSLSFDVAIGATNQTSTNDPVIINNTGNYNATGKVNITAINLYGLTTTTEFLDVGNFSASIVTGGACSGDACVECAGNTVNGTLLVNGTSKKINGVILNKGNLSVGTGTAQENFYYCILQVPSTISSQNYNTEYSKTGGWTITIEIIFIFTPKLSKKRKKKKQKPKTLELTKDNRLVKALSLISEELKEKYKVSKEDVLELIKEKEIQIPLDIFKQKLSPSEALTKYLKENKNMKFSEISRLLNRNQRTTWINYRNARKKKQEKFKITKEPVLVPVEVFSNRKLSILESLTYYLKTKGLKNAEIAKLLNKNPRNIWTIYSRAVKKLQRKI